MSNDTPICRLSVQINQVSPLFGPSSWTSLPEGWTWDSAGTINFVEPSPVGASGRPLVTIANQNIHVHGEVILQFMFMQISALVPSEGTTANYRYLPLGISYSREDVEHGGRPANLASLPREDIRSGFERLPHPYGWPSCPYIRLHNTWSQHGTAAGGNGGGTGSRVAWKYYIFFQNEYGTIGAIDPDIENDAEPA
jgi:hypothetical protein